MCPTSIPTSDGSHERGRPDIDGDIRRLWDVLTNGGIAIVPTDLGYGLWGGSSRATERIISAKKRGAHKRQGMLMNDALEREIHVVSQRNRDIIDCVTKDYNLPLGVIARYRADHPLLRKVDALHLKLCTARGTISSAVNAGGPFHDPIGQLSLDNLHPVFGSSANLTGSGVKYRVEDIEPEIIAIADLVLDYGLRRCHSYLVASTQINFETMQVARMGACYELIADVLKRHFGWDLPLDPGRAANRSGIVDEFALAGPEN